MLLKFCLVLLGFMVSAAIALDTSFSCSTPGKISAVGCWHDEAGFVTGLAFEDDYGVRSPAMCSSRGEPDQYIPLRPYESITEIVACEGLVSNSGYSLITFFTDGSKNGYECGYGLSDYSTAAAARLGSRYKYYGISKRELRMNKYAKVAGNCRTITSGRVPGWFRRQQQRAARWYTDSAFHGASYTLDGKTFDKLSSINPVTGRECRNCSSAGYYYSQVFPLAQLQARCSADGTKLQSLESACWNEEYRPAPNLVVLAFTMHFDNDCDACGVCPDDQRADYLRSLAAFTVSEQLTQYRVDAKVKAGLAGCKPALTYVLHNTSLSIAVTASTSPREKEDVQLVLQSWLQNCNNNLCNCLPAPESCSTYRIRSVSVDFLSLLPRGVRVDYPSADFMELYDSAKSRLRSERAHVAAEQQANSARTQVAPPVF